MENASKALLMAAGVLIGILILTLAAYLFLSLSNSTATMEKQMATSEIDNFNNQFYIYKDKKDCTIYDIYSAANLAAESNKKYAPNETNPAKNNYYVAVHMGAYYIASQISDDIGEEWGSGIEALSYKLDYRKFVEKYGKTEDEAYVSGAASSSYGGGTTLFYSYRKKYDLTRYSCYIHINTNTGRVNRLYFFESSGVEY